MQNAHPTLVVPHTAIQETHPDIERIIGAGYARAAGKAYAANRHGGWFTRPNARNRVPKATLTYEDGSTEMMNLDWPGIRRGYDKSQVPIRIELNAGDAGMLEASINNALFFAFSPDEDTIRRAGGTAAIANPPMRRAYAQAAILGLFLLGETSSDSKSVQTLLEGLKHYGGLQSHMHRDSGYQEITGNSMLDTAYQEVIRTNGCYLRSVR